MGLVRSGRAANGEGLALFPAVPVFVQSSACADGADAANPVTIRINIIRSDKSLVDRRIRASLRSRG